MDDVQDVTCDVCPSNLRWAILSSSGRQIKASNSLLSLLNTGELAQFWGPQMLKFCDAVRHMDCGLVRLYDRSTIPHGYMGSFVLSL